MDPLTTRNDTTKVRKSEAHIEVCLITNAVIKQCALERDLTLFEAGDATEIGEKGVTLR